MKLTRVITTLEGFLWPYKCFITLTKQLTAVGYSRSNFYNIDYWLQKVLLVWDYIAEMLVTMHCNSSPKSSDNGNNHVLGKKLECKWVGRTKLLEASSDLRKVNLSNCRRRSCHLPEWKSPKGRQILDPILKISARQLFLLTKTNMSKTNTRTRSPYTKVY